MIKIGEIQDLYVVKKVDFGVYLAPMGEPEEKVLLPIKQVPQGVGFKDAVRVFIYKDSSDRLIATTNMPRLTMDQIAPLRVAQLTKIGAFLDWGLEKDLFLPYKEMTARVEEGDTVLVRLYADKSNRLCASMKGIYHLLGADSPYKAGDEVSGRVYEFSRDFGTFVAVDDKYQAMLPAHEDTSWLHIGDVITARVTSVKSDGKLDLSMREKAYVQINDDAEKVYEIIGEYGGVLPFTDKASPEIIKRETGLSKAAFKRAVGHLYKERRIRIEERCIRYV